MASSVESWIEKTKMMITKCNDSNKQTNTEGGELMCIGLGVVLCSFITFFAK
jgi:hypothetical protein